MSDGRGVRTNSLGAPPRVLSPRGGGGGWKLATPWQPRRVRHRGSSPPGEPGRTGPAVLGAAKGTIPGPAPQEGHLALHLCLRNAASGKQAKRSKPRKSSSLGRAHTHTPPPRGLEMPPKCPVTEGQGNDHTGEPPNTRREQAPPRTTIRSHGDRRHFALHTSLFPNISHGHFDFYHQIRDQCFFFFN